MFTSSAQRRRDRDIRRAAANRRIGHDNAYAIVMAPYAFPVVLLLLATAGGAWVWVNVDHTRLAGVLGAVGILVLTVYLIWFIRSSTSRARLMAAARGSASPRRAWHMAAAGAVLLIAAAIALVQS